MTSGVGASIVYAAWTARPLVIGGGGGSSANRLLKPFLDQAYVTQEVEGQELAEPVVARFDLDGLVALPPRLPPTLLTINYPLNPGEATPTIVTGNAQVLTWIFPEMQAGLIKMLEVIWVWNGTVTYTAPTLS